MGNRLPNVFIKAQLTGESIFTREIERLAHGLDANGALVIFPEGGNWTPHRWRRGIRRLEHQGRSDLAARARDMPNLLPPRPGGTLAAISACPEADVIFVAHAGLDNIITLSDVWGKFPINQVIRARWWRVPYDEVPRSADHEAQLQWLYDWWERIDTWISENRPGGAAVPEVVELPEDETAEPVGELHAAPLPLRGEGTGAPDLGRVSHVVRDHRKFQYTIPIYLKIAIPAHVNCPHPVLMVVLPDMTTKAS